MIYIRAGQQSQRTIMHNEGGSEGYEAFLRHLGWSVPLDAHSGFMGGLDPFLSTGTVCVCVWISGVCGDE